MSKNSVIQIKVLPQRTENAIVGMRNNELVIKVTATPEKGKANKAVVTVLSDFFQQPKSSFTIQRGHAQQHKLISCSSLTQNQIDELISKL